MLDVSNEIIQMYHDDNPPAEIVLTIDGVEYGARNILSGSVSIKESLCSGELFDLSAVEKNSLEFTFINTDQSITDLNGKTVVAVHRLTLSDNSTYDLPLGIYYIADAKNDGDYLYKCIAYDGMTKFDRNIDDWWNNFTFPATIFDIAVSLCNYCGVVANFGNDFANANMTINVIPTYFEGVSGTEVVSYIQEVAGAFLKCDRYGRIKLYGVYGGLFPAEDLYPSETLYPATYRYWSSDVSHVEEYTYRHITGDFTVADYEVAPITKVTVRNSESDNGTSWGEGTNAYIIESNPLLYNISPSVLQQAVRTLYNVLHGIAYHPFQAAVKCLPYLEVGDWVQIHTLEGKTALSPLFSRSMHGAHIVFDTLECKGREYREEVKSVSRDIKILNRRTHEIINNVGELSSTISEITDEMQTQETQIIQNKDEITLLAQRTGYQNFIVNSNFKDVDDRFKYWEEVDYNQTGYAEYVEDTDFILSNGKAVKITKNVLEGQHLFKQTINFDANTNLKGKSVYFLFLFKIVEQSETRNCVIAMVYGTKTDGTRYYFANSYLNPSVGIGKYTRFRFKKDVTEDLYLENIVVQMMVMTGKTATYEANNFCLLILDASEAVPAFGTWSGIATNDLISQINVSPDGVKISGEKVDIWGVTTFHNLDGTGETTIDGANFTAGYIKGSIIETAKLIGTDSSLELSMTRAGREYAINISPRTINRSDGSGHMSTYDGILFSGEGASFSTDVGSIYMSSTDESTFSGGSYVIEEKQSTAAPNGGFRIWEHIGDDWSIKMWLTSDSTNLYCDNWDLTMGGTYFLLASKMSEGSDPRIYLTASASNFYSEYWNMTMTGTAFTLTSKLLEPSVNSIYITSVATTLRNDSITLYSDTLTLRGEVNMNVNGSSYLKTSSGTINYLSLNSTISVYIGGSGYANKTLSFKGFKATDGNTYYIPCLTI